MFLQADLTQFLSDNGVAVVALVALGFGVWRALPHIVDGYLKRLSDLETKIDELKTITVKLIERFTAFEATLTRVDRHAHALNESAKAALQIRTAKVVPPAPPAPAPHPTDQDISIIGAPGLPPQT